MNNSSNHFNMKSSIIFFVMIIIVIGFIYFIDTRESDTSGSKSLFSAFDNFNVFGKNDDLEIDNNGNDNFNRKSDSYSKSIDETDHNDKVDSYNNNESSDSNNNSNNSLNSGSNNNKDNNSISSSNIDSSNNSHGSSDSNNNSNNFSNSNNSINSDSNSNNTSNTNSNESNSSSNSNTIVEVSTLTLNYTSYKLMLNNTVTLVASLGNKSVQSEKVKWSSSNNKIATVSNGKVTGISTGTAIITATTNEGKSVKCTITVNDVNKIHYISNGGSFSIPSSNSSDNKGASPANTILLESNGHFALIDAGLKNSNSLNPNHAKLVINYLKKVGVKKLDFILITHDHYDHFGGLGEILDSIQTDSVYIKPYYSHDGDGSGSLTSRTLYSNLLKKYYGSSFSCDDNCLKNPDLYRDALKTIDSLYGTKRSNVGKLKSTSTLYKINANSNGKILKLGTMTLQMYNARNLSYYSECYGTTSTSFDENSNSIVSYIKMGNKSALIAGDLEPISKKCFNKTYGTCNTNTCSIMDNIVKQINNGKKLNVDLLELSHHGYSSCDMSASTRDLINPKTLVVPNWKEKISYYYSSSGPYPGGKSCRKKYFNSSYYNSNINYVGKNNLVFDFTNNSMVIKTN